MTTPNFTAMSGPEQVRTYNEMVITAIDLGMSDVKSVTRFADTTAGARRCEKMHSNIVAWRAGQKAADAQEVAQDSDPAYRPPGVAQAMAEKATEVEPAPAPVVAQASDVSDISWGEMTGEDLRQGAAASTPTNESPAAAEGESNEDNEMARKRKAETTKKAQRSPARGGGVTLADITKEFNSLVPAAKKLGINVKHHTSLFESKAKGETQLGKLKAAMKKAS